MTCRLSLHRCAEDEEGNWHCASKLQWAMVQSHATRNNSMGLTGVVKSVAKVSKLQVSTTVTTCTYWPCHSIGYFSGSPRLRRVILILNLANFRGWQRMCGLCRACEVMARALISPAKRYLHAHLRPPMTFSMGGFNFFDLRLFHSPPDR